MTAELRVGVKIGRVELEFEGSNKTFEEKIEPLLKDLIKFGKDNNLDDIPSVANANIPPKAPAASFAMTVKAIASKLGGGSGTEVLYAAVVSLAIIKKKETFTRKEINDEMKQAIGYYKATYSSGNLSGYLDALSKQGTIIETAKDTYAVNEQARKKMELELAN
jgi:hypothetical protein